MRSFQGAVLFVDMLGFSALTRGKLNLTESEYTPWKITPEGNFPHQLLAAQILLSFRKILMRTGRRFKTVKLAQLSDCAFLWSEDLGAVTDAGRFLMHEAIEAGLLCRGGLAFGDIHEPNKIDRTIGAFIVGDAVTRAATYETMGKGMRVFTDADTAAEILLKRLRESFHGLTNPLTGETVDEWLWYAPESLLESQRSGMALDEVVRRLVSCHTMLRYSPRFAWNAVSPEGCRQLACSIVAISDAMQKLSRGYGEFEFTVEYLIGAMQSRKDAVRERVQKQFSIELLEMAMSRDVCDQ
ncbi:hypothetical protein KDX38_28230 [Pseudomonas sp. CDFA 602]|uniref:hypothetical protein n=1 Tax=Pseudomonas californiensis TaxID=2829823 RepID=UPI001E420D28|nr:hypothetical protein [Pseudomonas californiensis]MCD5997428.1 hypothetical protein [Pseudomonas californiensis]MCD6003045.1 hypothetical protein [Pseudomonas californiensis]